MESANRYDLIVIGGGPAGSSAAAIAARAGLRVLLLEAAAHPRVHVGESLLPGILPILEEMGALADIEAAGFTRKTGSTHWGWGRTPAWDLWFRDSEAYDYAWLVDRARFDEILLGAAARAGAVVHEHAAAKSFLREGERVVGITWRKRGDVALRFAHAPLTIDATGQAALIARELGLRTMIAGLQHQASWAHFEGAGRLPSPREAQALFVATSGQWMWHFPLSPALTSIGLVRLDDARETDQSREHAFDRAVRENEELLRVIGSSARRVTPVRSSRDWSYRVSPVSGPGWLLAGDAAGFIDPVLSTGVLLAMHAGFHAARTALAVQRRELTEENALERYRTHHAAMFGDLLRIVRFFYQQNLSRDDYFWESKRMLLAEGTEIRPQKAFMILTSGLVQNLAFDEKRAAAHARREFRAVANGEPLDRRDPDRLGFVCLHLRYFHEGEAAALYFLVEPKDPAAPALFRTVNWHLTCLAPRFDNDPIQVPALARPLRLFERTIDRLDTRPGESLASFWRRARGPLAEVVHALPPEFELVRVFGE